MANFFIRALAGDFPQAWPLYECRFQLPGRTTPEHDFPQPRWQGEQLAAKLYCSMPSKAMAIRFR